MERRPRRRKASKWDSFLASLSTSGGNLALLSFFVVLLLTIIVPIMVKYGPASPTAITLTGVFSGFAGALLNQMKGSRVETPPPDMASSTTTVTSTVPPPARRSKK